ncbi:MAG: hypothetical protein L0387_40650 [Acidobacteria bacterium]|nr:hypothetical protein [Acidobacteriota bacterium]
MEKGEIGRVSLDLRPDQPLIESLGVGMGNTSVYAPMLRGVDVAYSVTVGTRFAPPVRPERMSKWNVFFDNVDQRPFESHRAELTRRRVLVASRGKHATVTVRDMTAGPFTGRLELSFYPGSRLMHVEAVVLTEEDNLAILYDAGLTGDNPGWQHVAWMDVEGEFRRLTINDIGRAEPRKVKHRLIIAESARGAVAVMPPPHQFFDPRDFSDNLQNTWAGHGWNGVKEFGFGVRHSPGGGGNFRPWFNAPRRKWHRLGMFLVLTRGDALAAFGQALRFTHNDRFPHLPGHITFTSHYHIAHTVEAMKRKEQRTFHQDWVPEWVQRFKGMNVNAMHLGEFHGDGHPRDPGPLRLPELETMFSECRRLSDGQLLVMPGEEANVHLGLNVTGRHPGHWMLLLPKPVYWTMVRPQDKPFVQDHPKFGRVYHVGSGDEMVEMIQRENGLAWTAHPRIKGSSRTPDIFKDEDFFKADFWLGAAFKAMPGDLSRERLGERALDLLNDMANWGVRKYLPGEVDTFKLFKDHEIYGHMNINYLRLARLPRFDDGWQPVLNTLRAGAFFTTTGEVLIKDFMVNGKRSGEELNLPPGGMSDVRVELDWTFPLKFGEVISGDGLRVYRERINLEDTGAFGQRTLRLLLDLKGRTWVRFEAWDVAVNGAYTQPVWLK